MDKHFIFFKELYNSLYINNNLTLPMDYDRGKDHFLHVYKIYKQIGSILFDEIYYDWFLLNFIEKIKTDLLDNEHYEYIILSDFLIVEITHSLMRKEMIFKHNGDYTIHPYLKSLNVNFNR